MDWTPTEQHPCQSGNYPLATAVIGLSMLQSNNGPTGITNPYYLFTYRIGSIDGISPTDSINHWPWIRNCWCRLPSRSCLARSSDKSRNNLVGYPGFAIGTVVNYLWNIQMQFFEINLTVVFRQYFVNIREWFTSECVWTVKTDLPSCAHICFGLAI